jgi:tRNA (uracil-5-)-methyltransferase TRM9
MPMGPKVVLTEVTTDAQTHEDEHVHTVYDQIASHFSSTRYKVRALSYEYVDRRSLNLR